VAVADQAWDDPTPAGPVHMVNLIATIPGQRPDRIVISGHYDTKLFREARFVGANDGGSSAAMLLELARVLKARRNPFTIEFVRVTHSMPDCVALAITTPVGLIVHTGDFKIDQTPLDGQYFDLHRFAELGRQGVLALFTDSTNIDRKGFTGPEIEVVALTGTVEEERVMAAIEAGAAGFLLKDAGPDDVAAAIRAARSGEMYLAPAVAGVVARQLREPGGPIASVDCSCTASPT